MKKEQHFVGIPLVKEKIAEIMLNPIVYGWEKELSEKTNDYSSKHLSSVSFPLQSHQSRNAINTLKYIHSKSADTLKRVNLRH